MEFLRNMSLLQERGVPRLLAAIHVIEPHHCQVAMPHQLLHMARLEEYCWKLPEDGAASEQTPTTK
jgi:hypothetical protein